MRHPEIPKMKTTRFEKKWPTRKGCSTKYQVNPANAKQITMRAKTWRGLIFEK